MVTYTPNERHADALGTFHTGPGDDIATLWSLITTTRILNGRHAGTRPVLPQRAGYKRPRVTHVPAGNGTLEHTKTVADAVTLCERAGVEFWSLAPAGTRGVFGVRTLADGTRTYVIVRNSGRVDPINADGTPRDDVRYDDAQQAVSVTLAPNGPCERCGAQGDRCTVFTDTASSELCAACAADPAPGTPRDDVHADDCGHNDTELMSDGCTVRCVDCGHVFEPQADPAPGAVCDECGASTNAGVSDEHTDACSLHPSNIVGAVRPLHAIARDIRTLWPNMYFGAVPYVDAMSTLTGIGDMYGMDHARDIVRYFLANASTWRGADARRIKAELKALIGIR